jgi:hypothetical protein
MFNESEPFRRAHANHLVVESSADSRVEFDAVAPVAVRPSKNIYTVAAGGFIARLPFIVHREEHGVDAEIKNSRQLRPAAAGVEMLLSKGIETAAGESYLIARGGVSCLKAAARIRRPTQARSRGPYWFF